MSELTEMEKYLQKLFTEAGQDLKKKFLKYTQDFQRLDAAKQQAVEDGNITEDEYKEWRKNKLLYGMHWQRLIDRNTSELLKYNQTAVKYINGEVPQIFASGYNKVAEQIPDSPVAGFDFELINADTVNNLVHEDGIILPPKKKVDPEKDKAWNAKLINAQLLQGIMQGESIPDMAKRMQTVANSDLAGATRTARTMHTAAQNAGRQSGYNKAAKQGIIFEKTWISARQINRTRDTHYALHGTTVPYNEKFVTIADNELEFPGDWRAPAEEVYNCFLGETIIASDSDVVRSYKHKYTGRIISVETAGGVKFSCTPNHPILTPRGWVAAEFIKSSDDILVTFRGAERTSRINPNINHTFARIDAVHEFFNVFGRKRTCRLGVNFHGDIPTTDVEIITQKWFLWYHIKSVIRNSVNKLLLKHADSSFMCKGTFMKHFGRVMTATFSNIGGKRKTFSFIGRSISHTDEHSLRTITSNNVILTEYPIDNLAAESVLDGELLCGLSGKVFVDNVVSVNVFDSSTHVYNLQTENGYYFVNSSVTGSSSPDIGIFAIAHNCRCTLITKFKGFKKLNGEEPERIEHEIPKEEAKQEPETKSYITAINDLRQKFNGTSDIYERERIVCEAGREMVNAHYENGYYSRLEELRNEMNSIYKEYNEKINELRTAYRELDKERRNPEYRRKPEEYEKLTKAIDEAYQKWREAEKERDKILNPLQNEERKTRKEMLEFRKELLKEVRECGTDYKMKDFFKGSKRVQEVAFDCLSNYPKEWVEAIRQDGILDCADVSRGFYSYKEKKLRLSDSSIRCAYHELGHAIEHNVQAVLDAEKAFYERRTKDEKLEWMGPPYKKSEKSRKDNFINVYMGKDYDGKAYELVSMGFESYFADTYEIEHDKDYQEFIMGVLAIC